MKKFATIFALFVLVILAIAMPAEAWWGGWGFGPWGYGPFGTSFSQGFTTTSTFSSGFTTVDGVTTPFWDGCGPFWGNGFGGCGGCGLGWPSWGGWW
jgi:hypothetical protein